MLVKNGNKMGLRKLIKTSFEVYYKNIAIWLFVCLLVYSPLCIRDCMVSSKLYNSGLVFLKDSDVLAHMLKFFSEISASGWFLFWLPNVVFVPIGRAVISFVVSQTMLKKNKVISEILDNSLLKWKKLLLASIFYNIIFLVSLYCFYPTMIALNNCGAFSSMIMSCILLRKHLIKTVFLISITKLFSLLASFLFGYFIEVFFFLGDNFIVHSMVTWLFSNMIGIFFNIVLIVWFLNMFSVSIADLVNKNFNQEDKNKKDLDL